jgi:anti-sigma-K factor RskA
MTRPPTISPEERNQLAAEFALGLLEADELAQARSLFADDPQFRASVGGWLGRFAPLLDEIEPIAPGESVWAEIERRLGAPAAANDNVRAIRRKLNLWRGVAAGTSALAASLAVVMLTRAPEIAPPISATAPAAETMVAMLGDEQKGGMLVASWNAAQNSVTLSAPAPLPGDAAHAHELWIIPADGTPRSLGTMPAAARIQLPVAPQLSRALQEGATLAISVEPLGGSPTGLPTGPVIASGKLERV